MRTLLYKVPLKYNLVNKENFSESFCLLMCAQFVLLLLVKAHTHCPLTREALFAVWWNRDTLTGCLAACLSRWRHHFSVFSWKQEKFNLIGLYRQAYSIGQQPKWAHILSSLGRRKVFSLSHFAFTILVFNNLKLLSRVSPLGTLLPLATCSAYFIIHSVNFYTSYWIWYLMNGQQCNSSFVNAFHKVTLFRKQF